MMKVFNKTHETNQKPHQKLPENVFVLPLRLPNLCNMNFKVGQIHQADMKSNMGKCAFLMVLGWMFAFSTLAQANGGLNIGHDTTICSGQCLTLSSNISGTYLWSTAATTASITLCPTSNQTISLRVINGSGTFYDTMHITVDNACVWPGDADNNGAVTKHDVLKIGLAYGHTGAARANANNSWEAQHAANWDKNFKNGTNYKHADCNGDGVVDSHDLDAVHANWSHTHNKTEATTDDGNPNLYYVANHDTVSPGDTLVLQIYLGTETSAVSNIYGVAFTHQFDPNTIGGDGSLSLVVGPANCWLYGPSTNQSPVMMFFQTDTSAQSVDIALSRTNGSTVSGYGQIGVLTILIPDNVGGKVAPEGMMEFSPIDIDAISNDETNIPLSVKPAKVYFKSTKSTSGVNPAQSVATLMDMYPNPLKGSTLTIHFSGARANKLEIVDMLGRTVCTYANNLTGTVQLDLPSLGQGMYLVRATTPNGILTQKLNIITN